MINGISSSNFSYGYYSSIINYNNVSSMNKYWDNIWTSSIYNEDISSTRVAGYADSFRSKMSNLEESSQALISSQTDSVFNKRSASSSDTAVVTAQADPNAVRTTYEVDINQLAKAQINNSNDFDSDAANNFTTGDNTFQITQDGSTAEFTVNVESTDTNKDVLNKMASAVNDSDLDISAKVVDNSDGTSYLQVEADSTGADYGFSISDVSNDLVSQTGISTTSQEAQDAQYVVDSTEYSSSSNEVTVDEERLTLNLEGVGSAEVTVESDREEIRNEVESFIEDYNQAVDTLRSPEYSERAIDLADSLTNAVEYNESDLEDIGINVDAEGRLSLDEDEFNTSLEEDRGEVEDVIGSSTGVAAQINQQADTALSNPISSYLDWGNSDNYFDYNLYSSQGQSISPFFLQPGMMFDFYL